MSQGPLCEHSERVTMEYLWVEACIGERKTGRGEGIIEAEAMPVCGLSGWRLGVVQGAGAN